LVVKSSKWKRRSKLPRVAGKTNSFTYGSSVSNWSKSRPIAKPSDRITSEPS
jgi:hypothetical protein